MSAPRLLIYDDARGDFGPLDDLRSITRFRTGILTNLRRIERALNQPAAALVVPPRLLEVETACKPVYQVNPNRWDGAWFAVNGRWTGVGEPPEGVVTKLAANDVADFLKDPPRVAAPGVVARPWHVLDQLEATLAADLAAWTGPRVAATASVHPSAVIDESLGPVVIDEHAAVEPLAVLQGPLYVGQHTIVRTHANLRPNTVVGPHCRVGGEVSFTIIHAFTNKAHLGFLGHALVGAWVNLGADTNCSNLKNTYQPVRVHLVKGQPPQSSDRLFLGPVVGDHVRTAIGTRINTGSVLGTGSMIVTTGYTPAHVPPLSFLTDAGCRPYDLDKLIDTARTVMARRGVELRPAEENLLRALAAPPPD